MQPPLGKACARGSSGFSRSERADRGHALDELERASLLRRGVDALRQHELDLARDVVEAEHEAELALPSPPPTCSASGSSARVSSR